MPKTFPPKTFPNLPRIAQETLSYCGPTVIQMFLGLHGVWYRQSQIVEAAQIGQKIDRDGMTIGDMVVAVRRLAPHLRFWYKHHAKMSELSQLVNVHRTPVGVEWQGMFKYDTKEEEERDKDEQGHYSIVTALDTHQNFIRLADPFWDFAGQDRQVTVLRFARRWWDMNDDSHPLTGHRTTVVDYRTMFLVTSADADFPRLVRMTLGG